jgi:hypothetical protein
MAACTRVTVQHEENTRADTDMARRRVLTKATYASLAIMPLPVMLSFAAAGSGNSGDQDKPKGTGKDKGEKVQDLKPTTAS